MKDDEFVERLSLIEDELIEDFARNALSEDERKQFESYFLSTPKRRRKLMLVRGLRKYTVDVGHVSTVDRTPARRWFPLLSPQWAAVAGVVLITLGGFVAYRIHSSPSDIDKGLVALNEAYKAHRPVQARVTGLDYAPYSTTRGSTDVDSRSRDLSAALLQNAVSENSSSPEALHALGRYYLFKREFDKAIANFEDALKSNPNDARLHSDLGAALLEKGKLQRDTDKSGRSETTLADSLAHLHRALELDSSLLDARFNRALLYENMRLNPQALDDWNRYLTLDPNSRWADEARQRIEEIKKRTQQVSQRNDDLLAQFFEAQKVGDREKMWRVFSHAHLRTGNSITNKLIDTYLDAAATPVQSDKATESLATLAELGKLSTDKAGDRFTADSAELYRSATRKQYMNLLQARKDVAAAYESYSQSKNDLAIPLYNRARNAFAEMGNHPEALLASFWLSFCYMQLGDTQTSLSIVEEADRECEARSYKWLRSLTQIGLASSRILKTQYSRAVEHAWTSYRASQQIEDQNGELRGLNMLAGLYRDLGDYRRSLNLAQQGLGLGLEISADASQMTGLYATSAWSLNSLGYHPAALEYEKQALGLGEVMNNPLVRSRYYVQMGLIQMMLKNYEEAISNIRLGIQVGQGLGEETIRKEMTSYGQFYLGRAYRESGNFGEALAAFADVEHFCQRTNEHLWLLHEVKKEQLLTLIAREDIGAAATELPRVLNNYEDQRQEILEESNRHTFFDKEQTIYDVAIDFAQSHSSNPHESFDYSERSRGRSLLDASTEGFRVSDDDKVPEPRFSSAVKPKTWEELRYELPDRAQLLQFAVLKDKLLIWYLSRDRFETAKVNISSDELRTKVDRLLNLVTTPDSDDKQVQKLSGELYGLLVAPLAQRLDPQKQLCIVPDKILNLLPFNTLFSPASQKYLVEEFALSYAPSANLFVLNSTLASKKAAGDEALLAVGNPSFDRKAFPDLDDLPSALAEVDDIGQLYTPHSLLRAGEAKKVAVLNEMRNADVLHFATHYLPDANSPMLGRLVLASEAGVQGRAQQENGVLHAYEVFRLKPLRARLAVLAGCKTGVQGYINGEGPIGLARPFNTAGVPLVIASLWPVESQATTELMIEFHRLRKQKRLSSAEALRAAQVQMLRQGNPSHRSPYYWASFSLTGGYSDY